MCEMDDMAPIELTGADGEKWEYQRTSVATVTTADFDGWAIRQKETLTRDRSGGCSPFAREYVWAGSDRPWYQVPGHSLSGLPLSSSKTFEGLIMNNQLTPCYVSEMPGEKARALLIDFAVEAWTHPASPLINGFPAGQESHPRAIVMFETGDVRCVHVNAIQVINAEGIFNEYAFPQNDGSTSPI